MGAFDVDSDEFCGFYDELPLWSSPFARLLLEHVPLRAGMDVLDVGAGTGFLAIELAQRCGTSARITAVDPWDAALRRLRAKLAHLQLSNVRVVNATLEASDLPSGAFDLVVGNLVVNNFREPEVALEHCHRLLRPGGTLMLTTNLREHMVEFYDAYRVVLEELELPEAVGALDAHVLGRVTEESLARMLRDAGFEIDLTIRDAFGMRFADGRALLDHHFVRLAFLPDWRALCPEPRREHAFALLERRLNARAQGPAAVALTIPMLCMRAFKPG